jgi:hypothetical protein
MTNTQTSTLWEICRQGLPLVADEAAECWDKGQPFEMEPKYRLARSVDALINQSNWEIGRDEEFA